MDIELIQALHDAVKANNAVTEDELLAMAVNTDRYENTEEAREMFNLSYRTLYEKMVLITPTFEALRAKIIEQDNFNPGIIAELLVKAFADFNRKKGTEEELKGFGHITDDFLLEWAKENNQDFLEKERLEEELNNL